MTISGIAPGKIIAVHLNYPSRAAQRGRTPAQPSYFLKPSSSLAASGDTLERPAGTELLAFEGEIALVIGEPARRVSPDEGWKHVASVTAANDFGLYDLRAADRGSNVRSKGGDGFTPLGPNLIDATSVDPAALRVRTWVNGELVQEDSSDTLLFPFGRLVADLSQLLTLETGDIILTGTPAGSSVVVPGDVVEVEVDAPDAAGRPSSGRLVTTITEGTVEFGDYGSIPEVDDRQRIEAWGDARAAGLDEPATDAAAPPSSSPTSCATCWAPSASRPSACSCGSAATPTSSSRACTPTGRAPESSAAPAPCGSSRSGPTSSHAAAAASTRRSWRSTPSAPARCS
jgi:2-keto-4-pentenoate hydratase/2-oxohepta-3-ene-1,7-dioic acid hydratase in catechol pathway